MDERKELNRWLVVLGLLGAALLLAANLAKAQEITITRPIPVAPIPRGSWTPAHGRPVTPAYWAMSSRTLEVKVAKPRAFVTPERQRVRSGLFAPTGKARSTEWTTIRRKYPRPCSWDWYLLVWKGERPNDGRCR